MVACDSYQRQTAQTGLEIAVGIPEEPQVVSLAAGVSLDQIAHLET